MAITSAARELHSPSFREIAVPFCNRRNELQNARSAPPSRSTRRARQASRWPKVSFNGKNGVMVVKTGVMVVKTDVRLSR
jgi:hypothetical protein